MDWCPKLKTKMRLQESANLGYKYCRLDPQLRSELPGLYDLHSFRPSEICPYVINYQNILAFQILVPESGISMVHVTHKLLGKRHASI